MIIEITSLGMLMEETITLLVKQMDSELQKQQVNITMEEFALLSLLESNTAFTGQYISKLLKKSECSANRLLESLLDKGILEGLSAGPLVFKLKLTPYGSDITAQVLAVEETVVQRYLNSTSRTEVQLLAKKVKTIQEKIDK